MIKDDGNALLGLHAPAPRKPDKPVYPDDNIRRQFLCQRTSDRHCTETNVERLREGPARERHDGEAVALDPERCFDLDSVQWYRKRFADRNPSHDGTLSNLDVLHHWDLVVEADGRLLPTRAAILLFGTAPALNQILPRPVVDWQWSRGDWSEEWSREHWVDRVVIETNLVNSWRSLIDRYVIRADKPFYVDPETLLHEDRPPDYIGFREAVINVLVHQEYADHTRKATIQFFDDRTIFWNPGDAFASADELLDPGGGEVRNPRIAAAFRRIGLSRQAGTGIRAIIDNSRQLGRVPPTVCNDEARNGFQLIVSKEKLLSRNQLLFQASLGVRLDDSEH